MNSRHATPLRILMQKAIQDRLIDSSTKSPTQPVLNQHIPKIGVFSAYTSIDSVHFLDGWATTASSIAHVSTGHSTLRHSPTACSLVYFHHDRIHNSLQLLLLRLEFIFLGQLVLVKPIKCLLHGLLDL